MIQKTTKIMKKIICFLFCFLAITMLIVSSVSVEAYLDTGNVETYDPDEVSNEDGVETFNPEEILATPSQSIVPELTEEPSDAAPIETSIPTDHDIISPTFSPEVPEEQDELATPDEETDISPSINIIDETSVIVYTYNELNSVLSDANNYTTIYIGANITMPTSGIRVHTSKQSLIIDGTPPGETQRYTLTESASLLTTGTINIRHNGFVSLEVRNLNLVGQNYYGPFCIYDAVRNASLSFENITYNGPQLAYNRNGMVRIIDADINIINSSATGGQEVAEAGFVELGGVINIVHSNSNSLFWLPLSNATLTILSNADVTIQSQRYFVYADGGYPTFVIKKNGSLKLSIAESMTYGTQRFQSLSIEENGSLIVNQSSSNAYASLRIASALNVESGATLEMFRSSGSTANIEMISSNAIIRFNQPKKILLYNTNFSPIEFGSNNQLQINTNTINLWRSVPLGTQDQMNNMPNFIWNKDDTALLTLQGTFSDRTPSSITTNLTDNDPIDAPLNTSNFNFTTMRMFALGQFYLDAFATTQQVYGRTEANASVQITINDQILTTTADSNGNYQIDLSEYQLAEGDKIIVLSHHNHLKARQFVVTTLPIDTSLRFEQVPLEMSFGSVDIPSQTKIIPREDENWVISIWDGRGAGSTWRLDASIEQPLQASIYGNNYTLPNAMVYIDSDLSMQPLSSMPITVYTGTTTSSQQTNIQWSTDQGICIQLQSGMGYVGGIFTTEIIWSLIDAP